MSRYILCGKCYKKLPATLEHYHKDKGSKTGLHPYCKICRSNAHKQWRIKNPHYQREYRKNNRTKVREYNKDWRKRNLSSHNEYNKQRNRRMGGRGYRRMLPALIILYENTCALCLEQLPDDKDEIHVDHYFPVTRGGTSVFENLQPAHESCNISKKAKVSTNYHPYIPAIIEFWSRRAMGNYDE